MGKMRIDRFLAECGCGTRSEVKSLIKKGRVRVNDTVCSDSSAKVDTDTDKVFFDGQELCYEEFRYYMLNKPAGCVSSTRDGLSSTVLDILCDENTRDLFPVGRLDKDSEGLLLISNDGQLAHSMLSPKKHVDKMYYVRADKELGPEEMRKFRNGVDIGDEKPTLPAEIEKAKDDGCYLVTIREGRFHQIKRMFEALGSEVVYLKRISMGPLELDPGLEPGEYRRLTEEEKAALKQSVK